MAMYDLAVSREPVSDLHTYFKNPRRGDTAVIANSLTVNGQYKPIVVNRGTHTGRPNEVLAGNHTLMAARDLGWPDVSATFIDVDDDQAARIVAVDNRSADIATYDDAVLAELLSGFGGNLDGTGYTDKDLARLLDAQVGDRDLDDFKEYDEDVATAYRCPKCSYEWSGAPK